MIKRGFAPGDLSRAIRTRGQPTSWSNVPYAKSASTDETLRHDVLRVQWQVEF